MTAKKQNLIANGVLKADFQQPSDLLGRNNVEVKQLEEFVRRVAKHVGLPDTAKFADQGNVPKLIWHFSIAMESLFTVRSYH